ncbi:hypothetical protein QWJ34_07570 [Saccharibacillus sp. CPCC 101409]|uniref:hypothetical protein n=1 Tax=Saccharibacillus sp. CPCC 101409 TaxID=3058041 RepID=UPI0026724AA6|nr:hypothetical protein [Saccharibacillus sp. CPCC 101409]MDO3409619.1 hypothetical protein [Saccharibacillus sp. CPCC 101409]
MADAKPMLQPLRVASGWKLEVNGLYELDPSPETLDWFYGSILFSAVHRQLGYELYVRWEPEGDPAGCFLLHRYFIKFGPAGGEVLEAYLIDEQRIKSRKRLVERLEEHMLQTTWM